MKEMQIFTDSFWVKCRGIKAFRMMSEDSATVIYMSRKDLYRQLETIRARWIPVDQEGRESI